MNPKTTTNPPPIESYRRLLREQLAEKARRHPGFSLRSFARKSGVSHALLSLVMSGKKHLSRPSAIRIAEHLEFPDERRDYFLDLVEYETSSDERYREQLLQRMSIRSPQNEGLVLTLETFRAIADWYHFPLLELTNLDSFDGSARTAARLLGISELEAKAALDRLTTLGLLEAKPPKGFRKTRAVVATTSGVPSRSLREHHRQMIGKAVDSIEGQTVDRRYLSDMTIAIDRKDVAEVGRRIERFKRELSRFLNRNPQRDAVYQLNLQFFDLMKLPGPESPKKTPNPEKKGETPHV